MRRRPTRNLIPVRSLVLFVAQARFSGVLVVTQDLEKWVFSVNRANLNRFLVKGLG